MNAIEIKISGEALDVIKRVSDKRGMQLAIAREMDKQNELTSAHIQKFRMRGNDKKPFPVSEHKLGIISHHLEESIRPGKAVIVGDAVVSSIGSNIRYAGIQEFGGTIKRVLLAGSVRLRTDRQGNLLRRGRNGKLAVFAKRTHKQATAVAYSGGKRFETVIPARAPVRFGIADRLDEIGAGISKAILAFWNKGGAGA